jgi:hypothetical protein
MNMCFSVPLLLSHGRTHGHKGKMFRNCSVEVCLHAWICDLV